MQEEVTQRTVALCVEATRLSAGMLQQAMKKVLDEMQKGVTGHKTKLHHGKQTLRQLMKHNTGVSNIEITDQNIRAFSATAKKYGIDFALKKDTSGEIPPLPGVLQGPGCRRYHTLSDTTRRYCFILHLLEQGVVRFYAYAKRERRHRTSVRWRRSFFYIMSVHETKAFFQLCTFIVKRRLSDIIICRYIVSSARLVAR